MHMGSGSGARNNCLIDSLRQVLRCPGDASVCASVREMLRLEFPEPRQRDYVGPANFLTLDLHWAAVVRHLAQLTGVAVTPEELTVACVTTAAGDGAVEGTGARRVHLFNHGNSHFDPLLPTD